MSACGVCGKGTASDAYGRCSKCSAAIYSADGRGTPKGQVGTTFGSEKKWIAERHRTAKQKTVVARRGQNRIEA